MPAPTSANHAARKADVDALTTLTNDGLITLSNGTDYNTLVDPGFYAVTNAGSTNQPKSSAFRVIVLSSKNSNYVTQLAVPIYDQESPNFESSSVYFRNRNGNGDTWEKWRELALTTYAHEYGGKNYGVGGGLNTSPSGSSNECFGSSNLNDWDKSGFYSVSITDGQNTPTGQTSWTGILFALMRRWETGTSGLQVSPNGSAFWYRTRSGTEWNPWYILARDDQVVHRTGSESVAGIKNFSDNIQFSGHAVRQLYKNIGIAKGEVPSESQSILLRLIGGTGSTIVANTFSELELCAHNSGDTYVRLWAANNSEGSTDREYLEIRYNKAENRYSTRVPHPVTESNDNSIATTAWSVGKTGNRGNLSGFETPVVQSSALTVTNTSRDTNLVTGAVKITVNDGAANQAWTKTVAISNGSATISLGSKWKWYGGAAPDVSANCVLVLHWCSTFGVASLIVTA